LRVVGEQLIIIEILNAGTLEKLCNKREIKIATRFTSLWLISNTHQVVGNSGITISHSCINNFVVYGYTRSINSLKYAAFILKSILTITCSSSVGYFYSKWLYFKIL